VKNKNANGGSPPTANNGAGIFGSPPQDGTQDLSHIPSKASPSHPLALATEEDRQHDYSLRPRSLADFVGQERIRKILAMSIEAARKRCEPLDHVLFSAPPGLGKTSLAHIIARELGVNLRVTSGPAIERGGDLAAIVNDLDEGDVLFIDEIHRLARVVEEILYPAMEDFELNIVIGKRAGSAHNEALGQAVHDGRCDDPLRTAEFSAA
jgi:hypothetical protein